MCAEIDGKVKLIYFTPADDIVIVLIIETKSELARFIIENNDRASRSAAQDLTLDLTSNAITEGETTARDPIAKFLNSRDKNFGILKKKTT